MVNATHRGKKKGRRGVQQIIIEGEFTLKPRDEGLSGGGVREGRINDLAEEEQEEQGGGGEIRLIGLGRKRQQSEHCRVTSAPRHHIYLKL